ncbi:HmuY family protein [Fodinibius sp. Rm-B-1B1-1]|uniref:HmuY family protein n=1 Tax=Fodinibius alkaliphilus TaxID=3140241 RepID=UPI00315A60DE
MYTLNDKPLFVITLIASSLLLFSACSDDSTGPDVPESQLELHTAEDVPANPNAERGAPANYTFYDLQNGEVVADEDSASSEWDLAFSSTTVLTNSGVSGPGNGGAVILDIPFDEVTIAPSEGYNTDTEDSLAIPTGDENGWYNYTGMEQTPNHAVLPIEDKTIVVRTGDGDHYAKIRILSYYKGNPDISSDQQYPPEDDRYYTFEYAIQMNGTRELN